MFSDVRRRSKLGPVKRLPWSWDGAAPIYARRASTGQRGRGRPSIDHAGTNTGPRRWSSLSSLASGRGEGARETADQSGANTVQFLKRIRACRVADLKPVSSKIKNLALWRRTEEDGSSVSRGEGRRRSRVRWSDQDGSSLLGGRRAVGEQPSPDQLEGPLVEAKPQPQRRSGSHKAARRTAIVAVDRPSSCARLDRKQSTRDS